ncbi:hypothetical protein [Pelomonas cellulosilytica]|uniref:Transposase IS200-like domain-containing protein n=1 Tax=Pelomonas cellulosilytica TaxID=2906762 RepID=A0ABS8Y2V3_9BURK|nr:hypothetical protein [Pelomonas sp. P8]MCE4558025.1 hypothetical protein [Pelomonas sp. P8]
MERSIVDGEARRICHVYWHSVVGRDFVCSASLVSQIRTRLLGAHQASGRELLYYLLLPREIHLLSLLPPGDSATALGNGLSNTIARRVRQADGTMGAVFRDRYQSQWIYGDEQLFAELRMLAWRPVAVGQSAVPSNYAYGALRAILGLSLAEGFHAGELLERLGGTVPLGRMALRRALAVRPSEVEVLQWELAKGLVSARGTVGPAGPLARRVSGAAAALVAASAGKSIDGALELLELWVATRLGLPTVPSLAKQRGFLPSRGRALVACLAVQSDLCPASAVARHFGRAKATLSEQMGAIRCRPADRAILAIPMDKIVREAVALLA